MTMQISTRRRTKIIATLGPATTSEAQIEAMILAGMNVARFNFSHGEADDHRERARIIRKLEAKLDVHIAILGDLQGPKIGKPRRAGRQT